MLVPYQFPDLRALHRNSHIIRDSVAETLVTDGKNFSFLLIKWKLVGCGQMNHFGKLLHLRKFADDLYPSK